MTLQEFINLYDGTKIGDGQCVAMVWKYMEDVLNLQPQPVGNAHDYYDNFYNSQFLVDNFDRITYDGTNTPLPYDIIVWNTNVGGGYGHIAVVYQNITNANFESFDQNWNTPLLCNIETHNYSNVLGWLRLKTSPPSPETTIKKSKFPWVLYARKLRKNIDKS